MICADRRRAAALQLTAHALHAFRSRFHGHVRGEDWRVARVDAYDRCTVVTLDGAVIAAGCGSSSHSIERVPIVNRGAPAAIDAPSCARR